MTLLLQERSRIGAAASLLQRSRSATRVRGRQAAAAARDAAVEMALFRKKHGLAPDRKVFICHGIKTYALVRQHLLGLGWYENPEMNSLAFDLKWTLRARDVVSSRVYGNLLPHQVINHYKVCLTHSPPPPPPPLCLPSADQELL